MGARKALIQDWFDVRELQPGIISIREPLHDEDVRSYLVIGTERAILIDTGMGIGNIKEVVESLTSLPVSVLNSHSHWDHIGGNWRFNDILIHEAEADELPIDYPVDRYRSAFDPGLLRGPLPPGVSRESLILMPSRATTVLHGGERIDLGVRTLEIIHAPGHSPGGIVVLDNSTGVLFSTDVAYAGPLYCYSEGTDFDAYLESFERLAALVPQVRTVYPSHNEAPIEPGMIVEMRDALRSIRDGRQPDEVHDGFALHRFDGFAVRVAASADGSTKR